MPTGLRVLLVEDSELDAELLLRELRQHGFETTCQRVDSRSGLEQALAANSWDLVLSDHNLPGFSGTEALQLVRRAAPDIPFIVVSGSIGEDHAVEAMRAGAGDFIVKGKYHRLIPAVERELREAEHRQEQRRTTAALVESQQQLRQAQKLEAMGRLAGGVAHDFNNLLTAILGFADLVLGGLAADDPNRPDIEEIRAAGKRATDLTRQLLAFSRQQVLDQTVLDLGAIVEDVTRLLQRVIGGHITLTTQSQPGLWSVKVDRTQIDQIIMNLAVNSRDAMPNGGTLTIETANVDVTADDEPKRPPRAGEYVMLRVQDSGAGIPADILPRIFEPFFTTKGENRGTGLGLSTVYGIVQQSHGSLFVDTAPGKGTSFTIYFPRTLDVVSFDRPPIERATARGDETVLLVEDEDGVRELASRVLRKQGYSVLATSSPDEAIDTMAARNGSVDVLLTDVVMPGMSGPQLAARLRAVYPSLRVVFMSGFTGDNVNLDQLRGEDILAKPFTPADLARRVRDVLTAA
jgi:two-component system, cell cycle sensor histidine kinase and response regulator CckA